MTDLMQRLRDSATQARALDRSELLNEAADEIVKIRREVADMRGGLTDAEREALSWFTGGRGPVCPQHMATISGLLERMK